jgi:RNA polymerase sigma-70 factor (ECF subfamily)
MNQGAVISTRLRVWQEFVNNAGTASSYGRDEPGDESLAPRDDARLVQRCVAGDQAAFRELVELYQRRVYTIANGIVRNPDDAMDVVQDAFVKVHKHLPSFKGESSFYTWIYRIVVNLCIDRKRKKSRAAEVDYDDTLSHSDDGPTDGPTLATLTIDGPSKALSRKELREHMQVALEKLTEEHRAILVLREVEGLSYEELAESLGIAKGTVMSRLFHARKNFQKHLQRYLDS